MRIRYETGIAAFVQFVVGVGLSFIGAVASILSGCHGHPAADCASNTLVSLILVLITAVLLAGIAVLGYIAQARRSTRLALILFGVQAVAALFDLFDAKQAPSLVERASNLVSFAVAVWVAVIAVGLVQSRGRRIVSGGRRRVARP